MMPSEKDDFLKIMEGLYYAYGRAPNKAQMDFWWNALSRRGLTEIRAAVNDLSVTSKMMPTLSAIHEWIVEKKVTTKKAENRPAVYDAITLRKSTAEVMVKQYARWYGVAEARKMMEELYPNIGAAFVDEMEEYGQFDGLDAVSPEEHERNFNLLQAKIKQVRA